MKHIYIVIGSQGSYSDFSEWPVAAYTDKMKAVERVNNAYERSMEIQAEHAKALKLKAPAYWKAVMAIDQSNKYDKEQNPDHSYDEVTYCMWTVELK